jgi:hypothetical protein
MDERGSQSRTRVIWVTIVSAVIAAIGLVVVLLLGSSSTNQNRTFPLNQLAHQVKNGEIKSLEVSDDLIAQVLEEGVRHRHRRGVEDAWVSQDQVLDLLG